MKNYPNHFAYENDHTKWVFKKTDESQAYDYFATNDGKTRHSQGHAYFSKDGKSFIIVFKAFGDSSIGHAICENADESEIHVETKNLDGSTRWNGTLKYTTVVRSGEEWDM